MLPIALRVATGGYWLLLLTATHLPPKDLPKTHVSDKVEHFGTYGLLTTLLAACFWRSRTSPVRFFLTLVGVVWLYGAFDELTQPIFGRSCDVRDWLADASAAAIVGAIVTAVRR